MNNQFSHNLQLSGASFNEQLFLAMELVALSAVVGWLTAIYLRVLGHRKEYYARIKGGTYEHMEG